MLSDPLALDVVVRNVLENALAALAPVGRRQHRAHGARAAATRSSWRCATAASASPRRTVARLFEKFTRLHPGGGGGYYGTGLGLFIVRR